MITMITMTTMTTLPDLDTLRAMTARFAPVSVAADLATLDAPERRVLATLVDAVRVMDDLYLEQVWAGNRAMLARLREDRTALGQARLRYFLINKGPWSRLDHDRPFLPDAPPKPGGAGFYPADATKDEVAAWLSSPEGEAGRGFFTTIRRDAAGRLMTVPYSVEYRDTLEELARRLRDAAALTRQPSLAHFLRLRADAFLSDDYHASDVAWMEIDASIEPTIGPYEVYEDGWFNAKAAFEAFITVRDEHETQRLADFGRHLQMLEDHLPVDPQHRNPRLGALAPIRVVNLVFAAGEGNRGVQTAAFNLPNDERVIREHGAKRVMLRNVQQAKFQHVLLPIAGRALAPGDRGRVSFDAFFAHILLHELMHGLGPHDIRVAGRETTVRQELKETYSAIEEAKADIAAQWALEFLTDRGFIDAAVAREGPATVLASMFRSLRFGINEAHGRGVAIQLNFLLQEGAVRVETDGTFSVEPSRLRDAVTALTKEILTLQAEGDYSRARAMIARLGMIRPEMQRVLDRLDDVPVDIEPRFATAEALVTAEQMWGPPFLARFSWRAGGPKAG